MSSVVTACPSLRSLICPANCAGKGLCDWGLKDPECVCFDKTDKSPMCLNSPNIGNVTHVKGISNVIPPEPVDSTEGHASDGGKVLLSSVTIPFAIYVLISLLI